MMASQQAAQNDDIDTEVEVYDSLMTVSDHTVELGSPNQHAMEEENQQGSAISFRNVPDEVLLEIMRLLPSADRRRCRQVCVRWYNVYAIAYEDRERICISSIYSDSLNEVFATLTKSMRSCFHFEFHGIDFKRNPRKVFWMQCGPRISSLKMMNCKITSPPFANIVNYCSNLQELEFYFKDLQHMKCRLYIAYPSKCIPEGSQNIALRTLKIQFSSNEDIYRALHWLQTLNQLFLLFPNISNFSFNHLNLINEEGGPNGITDEFDFYSGQFTQSLEQSDRCVAAHTSLLANFLRDEMKSIAINYLYYPWLYWTSFPQPIDNGLTKITEMVLYLTDATAEEQIKGFLAFASHQMNLRKVKCIAEDRIDSESLNELISLPLRVTSLRALWLLLYYNSIYWTAEWSQSLSKSSLEMLRIVCLNTRCTPTSNAQYAKLPTLTDLAIEGILVEKDLEIVPLLESCPNLKHVLLSRSKDTALASVLLNQLKLESLNLNWVQDEGNPIILNHTTQLTQLKYLRIPMIITMNPYHFTNLKYLHVTDCLDCLDSGDEGIHELCSSSFNVDQLLVYGSACPFLEVVRVDWCIFPHQMYDVRDSLSYRKRFVDVVTKFVGGLKYLKFLHLKFDRTCKSNLLERDVSQIFQSCSSLQILIHTHTFVRDVIKKSIRKEFDLSDEYKLEFFKIFIHMNDYEWHTSYYPKDDAISQIFNSTGFLGLLLLAAAVNDSDEELYYDSEEDSDLSSDSE